MPWPLGKPRDETTKRAIKKALKGVAKTDTHRTNIGDAQRGKTRGKYQKRPRDQ